MTYETTIEDFVEYIGSLPANTLRTPYDVLITDTVWDTPFYWIGDKLNEAQRYVNLLFVQPETYPSTIPQSPFHQSQYLVGCDMSNLELPNVITFSGFFTNCSNLKNAATPKLSNVTTVYNVFNGCSSLESIVIEEMGNPNVSVDTQSNFNGINSLVDITIKNTREILSDFLDEIETSATTATTVNRFEYDGAYSCHDYSICIDFRPFTNLKTFIFGDKTGVNISEIENLKLPSMQGSIEVSGISHSDVLMFTGGATIELYSVTVILHNSVFSSSPNIEVLKCVNTDSALTKSILSTNANVWLTSLDLESCGYVETIDLSGAKRLTDLKVNNCHTETITLCSDFSYTYNGRPYQLYGGVVEADLSHNELQSVTFYANTWSRYSPPSQREIYYTNAINKLNLSYNSNISTINGNLSLLEELDLSHTNIETVNLSYRDPNVTVHVSGQPDPLAYLTSLTKLKLNDCPALRTVNYLEEATSLTDWSGMFANSGLIASPAIPNFVTKLSGTFEGCSSLTAAPAIPDSVTDMSSCFKDCDYLLSVPNIPDSVTDLTDCFSGCARLATINNWMLDISSLESGKMDGCFTDCSSLASITTPLPIDTESTNWRLLHMKVEPNVGQKLYVYNTNGVLEKTVDNISGAITLQTKSAELCLTDENISDAKRIEFQNSGYHYDNQGLDPLAKNFVLWKDPQSKFKTNIDFGGGGGGGGKGEPVPLGTLCSFNKDEAPSEYWLKCDGSAFDPGSYPALRTYLGKDTLPIEYDLENPNKEEVGKEIFVGEINGPDGNMRKVYQLTVTDNTDRSSGWYDFTSNFSPYLAPSEVDYFVDGAKYSHIWLDGDGYVEDAWGSNIIGLNRAKTMIRVYCPHQNYAMDYPDARGQNTDKYLTVRYTRTDDSQAKATIKYKYIRAVSGIDQGENQELHDFLISLREELQGYAVQPIGSTMSSISGVAPAGYLKADGRDTTGTADELETKYPLLFAMLGRSNVLPKMPDIDNSACALNEVKFAGFFLDEPMYKVVISHNISMSSTTWYEIRPASWVESMDMKSIVHSFMSDHYDTGAYNHGASPANMHIGESNRSLYIYPTGMETRASTWYVTIYFTKNNPPPIPYKFIKAISGVDETESSELVEYIEGLTDKVAYNTMPLGNIITLGNNSFVPAGYLEADGSQFDTERYPLLYQYLESDHLPNLYDRNSLSTTPDISLDTRAHTNYNPSAVYVPRGDWGTYLNNLGITSTGDGFAEDGELHFFGYYWRYIWIQHLDGSITGMQIPFTGERSEWYTFPIKKGEKLYGINTNGSATPTPLTTFDIPDYARMNIYYYHKHQYIKAISGVEENSQEASDITTQISALVDKVGYHTLPLGHIITLAKNSTVPAGYLECDGSTFDTTEYPLLYQYLESDKLPNLYDRNSIASKPDIAVAENWVRYGYRNTQLAADWLITFAEDAEICFSVEDYRHIWIENPDGEKWCVDCGQNNNVDTSAWFTVKKGSRIFAINQNGSSAAIPAEGTFSTNGYMCMAVYYYHKHQYIKAITGIEENTQEVSEITTQIEALAAKVAYNTLPVGNVIELANNTIVPAGYLPCDGSTFDQNEYPLLYQYLGGSNVLPALYNLDTAFGKQDVGLSTRSDYNPAGVTYTTNMGTSLTELGLRTDGAGFPADGFLFIETYHWYDLWIEDTDGTKRGYMVASRDDTQSTLWLPIKKGQKLYGWTRNGSGSPMPSTEWVQSTYTKLYIWYAKRVKYIKAVSGVEDESEEASTIVDQMQTMVDRMAYNCQPVGHTMTMANNLSVPYGYLLADGSEFDETQYPLLYAFLGNSNKLPRLHSDKTSASPDWFKTNAASYAGTAEIVPANAANQQYLFPNDSPYDGLMTIHTDDWCYLHITHADGTKDTYMIGIRDNECTSFTIEIKKGDVFCTNRTLTDYTTWVYYEYFIVAIWYYKEYQYIKAVSGVEENSQEASGVVSAVSDLMDKVAYNTMPVGNVIAMSSNRLTPTGYLLADGRDTTGTSEELQTKYPLLYSFLGNTNVLPLLHTNETSETPDWFKTNSSNYPGTASLVAADAAHQLALFPIAAEHDGIMTLTTDDWCYLHITHADGTKITKTVGIRDNSDNSLTWEIKKGDYFCMNRTANDYTNWAYFELTTVAIWYYKNYKYIKAVSGIEDSSTESTEVVNAINVAVTELRDMLLPTASGTIPGYIWID